MKEPLLLLDKKQIAQKLNRLAYQIYEDNFEENELVIAGVAPRGIIIAQRLQGIIENISDIKVSSLAVEITDRDKTVPTVEIKGNSDELSGKALVLVDDVLNSGKTLVHALGAFVQLPFKKMRTVVLVDRNHKIYPIATDYAGLSLSTVSQEHIDVMMENEAEEAVFLR